MLAVQYPMHMDVRAVTQPVKQYARLSDEVLMLTYAQQDDQKAFAELYARYKVNLYRYCVRMLNDEGLGADIYQEAWCKVIKARAKYKVKAKFKTYIFHVAHNLIIDAWRKRSSQGQKLEFVSIDDDKSDSGININLQSNTDIFTELVSTEQLEQFQKAVLHLPPEQRDALLLHYAHGFTLEDIAQMESVGRETIKSRLRYATKKLKHRLAEVNSNDG